ncbi:MAG TPA: hypothetical protein VMX79_09420 [bacterium]|nr:hypothetical protein [bacterium]
MADEPAIADVIRARSSWRSYDGRPSSCRIRLEDGEEVIYVTELKRRGGPASSLSRKCDGRGVVVIPLKELTKAGEDRST